MTNTLTASSQGGATIHAFGVRVPLLCYGMDGTEPMSSGSGSNKIFMMEAKDKNGKAVSVCSCVVNFR